MPDKAFFMPDKAFFKPDKAFFKFDGVFLGPKGLNLVNSRGFALWSRTHPGGKFDAFFLLLIFLSIKIDKIKQKSNRGYRVIDENTHFRR